MFHSESVKGVCWMKIVNKKSFECGAPPGVNDFRVPPGVISAFYYSLAHETEFEIGSWKEIEPNILQ